VQADDELNALLEDAVAERLVERVLRGHVFEHLVERLADAPAASKEVVTHGLPSSSPGGGRDPVGLESELLLTGYQRRRGRRSCRLQTRRELASRRAILRVLAESPAPRVQSWAGHRPINE
jgi:hypothetical protein